MSLPIENQRVKEVIFFTKKGNESQFSKEIGVSQPRINRLFAIDKRSGNYPLVSFEIAQAIINKFVNINAEWLLTGKGSMLKEDVQQDLPAADSDVLELLRENNATLKAQIKDKEEKEAMYKEKEAMYKEKIEALEEELQEYKALKKGYIQEEVIEISQHEPAPIPTQPNYLPPTYPQRPVL